MKCVFQDTYYGAFTLSAHICWNVLQQCWPNPIPFSLMENVVNKSFQTFLSTQCKMRHKYTIIMQVLQKTQFLTPDYKKEIYSDY